MEEDPRRVLFNLVSGFQLSQALHVAARLDIGDRLAAGPRSSDELAAETETSNDALYRLLRAVAAAGVLHESDGRRFELTDLGEGLRRNVPGSVHGWALMIGRPIHWNTWSSLIESVRTGANTFQLLHGTDEVVANAGVLLDRFGERCRVVGGSFFEEVPAGADAYLLKSILHDWEDAECVAILRVIRRAMPEHGVVLVLERDLGGPNENAPAKLSDLNMLVNPGGRERSEDEYAALFTAAGLRYVGATPTAARITIFEACLT